MEKLEPLEIDAFYKELKKSGKQRGKGGLSQQTIHHYHVVLNQGLNWAVRKRIIKDNPAKYADAPKVSHKEMEILSQVELNKVLAAAVDNPWGIPIILSAWTGARQGECLALTWDNVDIEKRTIYVCTSLEYIGGEYRIKNPKNEYSKRTIPIGNRLIDALKRHKEIQQLQKHQWGDSYHDMNLVCARENGTYMQGTNVTRGFQMMLDTLKIKKVRFHDLRHTHASILLQTLPVHVVSKRLGHKNPRVTWETYCHLMPNAEDMAADVFEQALEPPATPDADQD